MPDIILVIDQTPESEQDIKCRQYLKTLENEGIVKVCHLTKPAVSPARNRAIVETNADILLYLDDDIIPDRDLVKNHLRNYTNASIHGVAGSIFTPFHLQWVPTPHDYTMKNNVWRAYRYTERFDKYIEKCGFMYGGNFSVRRDVLLKVKGWDEHIINYGDRDLGIRMTQAGYRIDYDPEAIIIHLCAPVGGTRVTDPKTHWKGHLRCVSIFYLAFRHLTRHPVLFCKYGLWRAARFSFLLKDNFMRPQNWFPEAIAYFKAMKIALRESREGLKSPFAHEK